MNTACVAASDIDGDGDIDLFIGSRSVPNSYGEDPASMVLINDGKGHFRDDTKNLFPGLYKPGMVTSAVFCNIFSKEKKDLVIVGEWMAPRIFTYNGKEFIEQQTDLSDKFGWWQTVYAADLDGDGHDDLVLGNMGQNFYLQPDSVHPVKLWINDFDNNGTKDKVLSRTVNNRDVPVFSKKEITEQMPSLKKQNLKHAEYAKKSIQELFSAALIKSSQVKQFTYSASCVALNKGNGKFLLRPLPWYAQLSCLNVVLATDLNGDGKPDLLIGSNKFDFLPQFGRLDAAYGLVLINDGHGNFNWVSNTMGSLNINGCVRDIQSVMINGQKNYLWLRNDDFPLMMKPASGDKFFKN